jgi:SpoVK/Ycf46/Vps4 family AAA+-type ATPase
MFLTTNLADQIDDAFRSRIQFHLSYPSLSVESRRRVWKNCLNRVEMTCRKANQPLSVGSSLKEKVAKAVTYSIQQPDIEGLASWTLNGREIKNIVKTVYLWCRYNALEFSLARVEDGIELTAPSARKVSASAEDVEPPRKRPRV